MSDRIFCKTVSGIIFLQILFSGYLFSQNKNSFVTFNYTSKNGLPQNSVNDLLMDSGYIWFATEAGLVRFDGDHFKTFNVANNTNILSDHFRNAVATVENEKLFMDASGSFYQVKANQMYPAFIQKTRENGYHILAGGVLSREMLTQFILPNLGIFSKLGFGKLLFVPVNKEYFLVPGKKEIHVYKNKEEVKVIRTNGKQICNLFTIDNIPYLVDEDGDFYRINFEQNRLEKFSLEGDLKTEPLTQRSFRDNLFWRYGYKEPLIKVGRKLFLIRNGEKNRVLTSVLINDQLPENVIITAVLYDYKTNILFIGTDTKGLFVFKPNYFHALTYTSSSDDINNAYYAQAAIDSNTVISSRGLEFSMKGITHNANINLKKFNAECLLMDKKNQLWYAIEDSIYKYDFKTKKLSLIRHLARDYVHTFFEEGDSVWVGTQYGISYIKNDSEINLFSNGGKSGFRPQNIIRGQDGNIWFGSVTGVYSLDYNGGKVTPRCILDNVSARNMYKLDSITLVGTYGNGFYSYNGNRFIKMPLDEKGYLSIVHSFLKDKHNFIWISTNQGLFKTSENEIRNYLNDTSSDVFFSYFADDDGIKNIEFNGGCFPSSISLKNGYFSFPTMDGLLWFDPFKMSDFSPLEPVYTDGVFIDHILQKNSDNLIVNSNAENVFIQLSTPYWGNKLNVHIDYKLEGYNKSWIALPAGVFGISFSNLPSGNYVLKIRKRSGFGYDNYFTREIGFIVEKKYYETIWFILSMIICIALLVWFVVFLYFRNLRRQNTILEYKINLRTSELKSVNEKLKLNIERLKISEINLQRNINVKTKLISIISHDIVTPLRFISMIARNALKSEKQKLDEILTDIGSTSEKLHHNAQNILNWIRHQNNRIEIKKVNVAVNPLVEDIVEMMHEMAVTKGNQMINTISFDDLIRTDKNILSIIIHNILSNANKFTDHGTITISGKYEGDCYRIIIEDTGIGMNAEKLKRLHSKDWISAVNSVSEENGNGLGYIIVTELLELLGGEITIESTPGLGTRIVIQFC